MVSGSSGGVGWGVESRREGEGELPIGAGLLCVPRSNLISFISLTTAAPTVDLASAIAIG